MSSLLRRRSVIYYVVLPFLIFSVLYPGVVIFKQSPMAASTWELKDPIVSHFTFIPGFRVIRYELLNHFNLLWSNLRNLGEPILANDVQSAPLYPLTLLLFWAPPSVYWTLFIVLRLVLSSAGVLLIGSRILKFSRLQSFVLLTSFVFSNYALTKINHPWQNGMLAGIWYLYFLAESLAASTEEGRRGPERWIFILGQSVAFYSLLTCGFPEATAMSGLLTWLFLLPGLVIEIVRGNRGLLTFIGEVFASHGIGILPASPQIFSLIEYVRQAGYGFRKSIGLVQLDSPSFVWNMMTLYDRVPPPMPMTHVFNLIPIFLFLMGLGGILVNPRRLNRIHIASALLAFFFTLKSFSIWPLFNRVIGHLPILEHSKFPAYFFSLLIFGFAIFAGEGVRFLLEELDPKTTKRLIAGCMFLELCLLALSFKYIEHVDLRVFFVSILPFLMFCLALFLAVKRRLPLPVFKVFLCVLIVAEMKVTFPQRFLEFGNGTYYQYFAEKTIKGILGNNGNPGTLDFRERSAEGHYMTEGIATVDNGHSAILTDRARMLRTTLFATEWDGMTPIAKAALPEAWQMVSGGLVVSPDRTSVDLDKRTLTRAYIPFQCIQASGLENAAEIVKNPARFRLGTVVIEGLSENEAAFCKDYHSNLTPLRIEEDEGKALEIGKVRGPSILVLNDSYYPGWKVIDEASGTELEIKPANIGFRAVLLPESRVYEIKFTYDPRWLMPAYLMVGLGFLLMGGLVTLYFVGRLRFSQNGELAQDLA